MNPQSLPSEKPFSKRSSNLIRRLQVSSITFAFFSRSSYVADTPFASTLCPLPIFFVPFFHHFHSLGVLAKVMRGMREGRRGRCRSSTFANFNSRNLCPAECFGGGEMCERTGICVRKEGCVSMCVCVCVACVWHGLDIVNTCFREDYLVNRFVERLLFKCLRKLKTNGPSAKRRVPRSRRN